MGKYCACLAGVAAIVEHQSAIRLANTATAPPPTPAPAKSVGRARTALTAFVCQVVRMEIASSLMSVGVRRVGQECTVTNLFVAKDAIMGPVRDPAIVIVTRDGRDQTAMNASNYLTVSMVTVKIPWSAIVKKDTTGIFAKNQSVVRVAMKLMDSAQSRMSVGAGLDGKELTAMNA